MSWQQSEGMREAQHMNDQANFHKEVWDTLSQVNVNDHVEKKMNLSYLSWAWAWGVLMKHYPASSYEFKAPVALPDGSCEIWVTLTISNGVNSIQRDMWLPVMDHKNNAIKNPDARKINDTRMRCLTKCLALFGLGHYIYAGEDLPQEESPEEIYAKAVKRHQASIDAIKKGIAEDDWPTAAEAWFELSSDEKESIWKAPTKGGVFTIKERDIMKSAEFRKAHYGEEAA